MSDYEVLNCERVYDGQLSSVRIDTVVMPDGGTAEREVVEHPSAVAVVALDDDDTVLLLRHYRHPIGQRALELPAGKLDVEGEEPDQAARRELGEEAGMTATALQRLLTFHNSAGWTDEATTVYLATGLRDAGRPDTFTPEHEESDIELVRLPLAEAAGMAVRGDITDAKTVIGLLITATRRGLDLQQ